MKKKLKKHLHACTNYLIETQFDTLATFQHSNFGFPKVLNFDLDIENDVNVYLLYEVLGYGRVVHCYVAGTACGGRRSSSFHHSGHKRDPGRHRNNYTIRL